MEIEKSTGSLLKIQSLIAIPINTERIVSMKESVGLSKQNFSTVDSIKEVPWVLLELATQYYYTKVIGVEHPICRSMMFNNDEFEKLAPVLPQIFRNVTYYKITTPLEPYELWRVKIKGITDVGLQIVEKIPRVDFFSIMLHDLYIDCPTENASQELGLYECICTGEEDTINSDSSISMLLSNKYLKSIDISSVSFAGIKQLAIANAIASKAENTYIFVDKLTENVQLQMLCWV